MLASSAQLSEVLGCSISRKWYNTREQTELSLNDISSCCLLFLLKRLCILGPRGLVGVGDVGKWVDLPQNDRAESLRHRLAALVQILEAGLLGHGLAGERRV